jgi:hypothetical protein
MPATPLMRRESDQTAELQDLLSRLQEPQVDGELAGFTDLVKRSRNALKVVYANRATVLEKCQNLLTVTANEKTNNMSPDVLVQDAAQIERVLGEFIEEFKKIENKDENTDNETMTQVAFKWQSLHLALIWYKRDSRNDDVTQTENTIKVNSCVDLLNEVMQYYIKRFGHKLIGKFYYTGLGRNGRDQY